MADGPALVQSRADATARQYDPWIIFTAGLLMTVGAAMVYSASVTVHTAPLDWHRWWNTPLRQAAFAAAGFLVMLIAARLDYRVLAWRGRRGGWRAGALAFLTFAMLVAVLIPGVGRTALGARRAIEIPGLPFGFQPSELAKLTLVVWLAALLTRPTASAGGTAIPGGSAGQGGNPATPEGRSVRHSVPRLAWGRRPRAGDIRDFRRGFLPAVLSAGLLVGLTALEDFGTGALMGAIMLAMLLVAGARWSHLALTALIAAALGVGLVLAKPHRVARITTWWSGNPDPAGTGYQVDQALLAIGSGGWTGRGLGAGVQKYGYLPYDNNDFILAIICEELGTVGGLVVVGLFLLLLWRGWRTTSRAPDDFGRLLAFGLTLTICLQAAFNVGVVTNSVPTKGISLPFVSAGGSGAVFLGLAAGLLSAVGGSRPPPAS